MVHTLHCHPIHQTTLTVLYYELQDQPNVYSLRVIFSFISPNMPFHSFSLDRWSASYPPLQNKCPIFYHTCQHAIIESEGKIWSMYIHKVNWIMLFRDMTIWNFFKRPPAATLDMIWPKMAPLDPPSPKTPSQDRTWVGSVAELWTFEIFQSVWIGSEVSHWLLIGRHYSYFLHWCHILLFCYVSLH